MAVITPPSECPSCKSLLIFVNNILYCQNKSCGEKQAKLIENFASKMKIKGLGPSTIEKLTIENISDLYYLEQEHLIEILGEKLGTKLYKELLKSHDAPLNLLLPALGIPLVGQTATNKLAIVLNDWWDIDESNCREAGLGPKTIDSLLSWKEDNWMLISVLPQSMKFEKIKNKTSTKGVVCISG